MIKLLQVIDSLDMLDLVVTQIQATKFCEGLQALDVGDEVVI